MNRTVDDHDARPSVSDEIGDHSGVNLESMLLTLHSLSNKLLPIVICSELALKRCGEEKVRIQLEKIQRSAYEARELIAHMRQLSQEDVIGNNEETLT